MNAKTARKTTVRSTTAARKQAPAPAPIEPPSSKPAKPPKKAKPETKARQKLVRDSFTMPQTDYELIAAIKQRCITLQRPAKKSEVLRAGLHVLAALKDAPLLKALSSLVEIKSGRPKKAS